MNTFTLRFGGLALTLLFLLTSCMSPLGTMTKAGTALPALKAGETRLIFSAVSRAASKAATLADANYLTVQLKSADSVKFGSAQKAGDGSYAVVFSGLVAGEWSIRAMFYDNDVSQNLVFYALRKFYVAPGSNNVVDLDLYQPGSFGVGTTSYAVAATQVDLTDPDGLLFNDPNSPKAVPQGLTWDLNASVSGLLDDGVTLVPATDPGVAWSSSEPAVATVSSTGLVRALSEGRTTITARGSAPENMAITAQYEIEVVSGVFGTWIMSFGSEMMGAKQVYRFQQGTFQNFAWVEDLLTPIGGISGTYTFVDGILSMHADQELNTSTGSWEPYGGPEPSFSVPVTVTATSMNWTFTGGVSNIVATQAAPIMRAIGPTMVQTFARVADVPLTGITGAFEEGHSFSVVQTEQVPELGPFTPTPANATVQGVYWVSTNNSVVWYSPEMGRFVTGSNFSGSAALQGYAMDTGALVASYLVTVSPNDAPTVSITSEPISPLTGNNPQFSLDVSDGQGVAQVWYYLDSEGYWYGPISVETGAGTTSVNVNPSVTDGVHTVTFKVVDKFGMESSTVTSNSVTIDNQAPQFSFGTFTSYPTPNGTTTYDFTVTDNESFNPGSVQIIPSIGTITNLSNDGTTWTFDLDLTGIDWYSNPDGGYIQLQATDIAGNVGDSGSTYGFYFNAP